MHKYLASLSLSMVASVPLAKTSSMVLLRFSIEWHCARDSLSEGIKVKISYSQEVYVLEEMRSEAGHS